MMVSVMSGGGGGGGVDSSLPVAELRARSDSIAATWRRPQPHHHHQQYSQQ